MKISCLIHSPAPYHAEFFNALSDKVGADLKVIYLMPREPGREWTTPRLAHDHLFLQGPNADLETADSWMASSELAVFAFYNDPIALGLLRRRARSGSPWVFWGERPGFRLRGPWGRWLRRIRLRVLHRSNAPIWGIGEWALEGYRQEFGSQRLYLNQPYFSDLKRYSSAGDMPDKPAPTPATPIRFLFVGSLIPRKGVDLLPEALVALRASGLPFTMSLAGSGPLEPMLRATFHRFRLNVQMAGFQDWGETPTLYGAHDILVAPSRHDGWGMIVPEALAAGLPVIASDCMGSAHDLIQSGVNGWITRAGDANTIGDALVSAAKLEPEERKAMMKAARRSVSHHQLEDGRRRFLDHAEQSLAQFSRHA